MENYAANDFCEGRFCVIYIYTYIHIYVCMYVYQLMVHAIEPLRFASITWKGKKIEWKSSLQYS